MALQTTYNETMPVATPGMPVNAETWNTITRTAEGAISFGMPCFRGAADHGVLTGAVFAATGAGSAAAGNVGTSTITASPAVAAGAKAGRYVITQENTSGTGALIVEDPDGKIVGHGNVGTAITTVPGLTTFTVTAAGTPTAGDQFYIDVTFTANGSFLGISEKNVVLGHSALPDAYAQYDSVPVRTLGAIWVTCGATVAAGDEVYWNPATSRFTNTTTHLRCTGWKFDMAGADAGLVKIARR